MIASKPFARTRLALGLLTMATVLGAPTTSGATGGPRRGKPWVVRTIAQPRLAFPDPVGLAFSPRANAFLVMPAQGPSVQTLTHTADSVGVLALDVPGADALNTAFDSRTQRLLVLAGSELVAVSARSDGGLDPGAVTRYNVTHLGLERPAGMTVEASSGAVFILDSAIPRLVRVDPTPDGDFEAAAVSYQGFVGMPAETIKGLALDARSGHFFMLGGARTLYETSGTGELLQTHDVSRARLRRPGAITFAPSGDLTDDPSEQSLYVADASPSSVQKASIVELSFSTTDVIVAAVSTFTSSVVRTTLTSQWSPPAPDTSDVVYMPATNTLRVVDSEVDEMSIFRNVNEWESTLDGTVLGGSNLTAFTREPTGISVNPANGHLFYSDDDKNSIFELDPGPDGQYHTSDDVRTSFSTSPFGSGDAEDVTYNPLENVIYLADGVNREVYRITPGANGRFDGTDDVVTHFDTSTYAQDPECLTVNTDNNHLYIGGNDDTKIFEISTTGTLLQTIDISAANANNIGGIGFGRGSNDPNARRLYIVQRGVDNNSNPSENDGKLWEVTLPSSGPVNQAPTAGAGPDQTITLPAFASLDGTVGDDGLPNPPATLTTTWSKASGPGTVTFGNPSAVDTTASFSAAGTYVLRLTASDSVLSSFDELTIVVNPAPSTNQAPAVSAGPDQTITQPASATLDGTVNDDGRPNPPATVTTTWSKASGPGTVTFGNPSAVDTTASFSAAGTYVLRLTASDSVLSSFDDVTIVVNAVNQAPLVSAGADQTITLPGTATLDGTVTDDGLPSPPATVTTTWSKVSGPGTVTFGSATAVDTTASFSTNGTYVLRLTASDGALSSSHDVTVSVDPAPGQGSIDVAVSASTDDAEEYVDGVVSRNSSDLELVFSTDGAISGNQTVGLRFANLAVPQGASILNSYVQFTVDEVNSEATTLTLQGQASDNAATFGSTAGNISARPRTNASASWSPPAWTTVGAAGLGQRVDVTPLIDEIVHRSGWASGNALALIIQGTGKRVARAWDFGAATAPVLHVEYTTLPVNRVPVVTIAAPPNGSTYTVGTPVTFTGSASDTEDGDVTASLVWTSSLQGQIGVGSSFSRSDLVAGTHTITATATDSATQTGLAQIALTIQPTGSFSIEARVAAGGDDAEERVNTRVSLTSSDLEMVFSTESGATGNQTVGLRFAGIGVPQGATITNAYVQFTCDETGAELTVLDIHGQAIDDAPAFVKTNGNVSTRQPTAAAVTWSPPAWNTQGLAGPNQRTPDLTSVIQEIVDRPGWSSGRALALIVTGSGKRTASAFESGAAVAPLLHVEYTVP